MTETAAEAMKSMTWGTLLYPGIGLIIFLVLVIISGVILDSINHSPTTCYNDPNITYAKTWTGGLLGISTVGMILSLIFIITYIYFMFRKP